MLKTGDVMGNFKAYAILPIAVLGQSTLECLASMAQAAHPKYRSLLLDGLGCFPFV